jgi:hypothetical protein
MISDFQIKGLEKLANSGIIKNIYPMVDHVEIRNGDIVTLRGNTLLNVDIFLNDENITSKNMYDMELDPHYLIDKYLKEYLPYFDMDKIVFDFIVWGTDGNIIHSWKDNYY